MNAGVWVGQVVDAVRSRNAGALVARLDLRDATALTCVQRAQLNPAQLEMIASDKFSASRVPNADKWATVATEHLLALQLCQRDKDLVRSACSPCSCGSWWRAPLRWRPAPQSHPQRQCAHAEHAERVSRG